ncbi:MAG TPA: ABC transporter permease [Thermoleophilaceae bacterium]|nr:ABC transporter permease [Thermoleophilaceae bacterium]
MSTRAHVLEVGPEPASRTAWIADVRAHAGVLGVLARKDFQTRYKRASFGVLWAVAVPMLQAAVMAIVFTRVIRVGTGDDFGAYVIAGILAWTYFAGTLMASSTSIVDHSGLADKVWFPRIVLVLVPPIANIVGLLVSYAVLVPLLPVLGVDLGLRLLLLPVACVLLVAFTVALSLVLSALHVYYRDVRFLVQAALLVWLYVTPVVYRQELLDDLAGAADFNPMTGVVTVFHAATVGAEDGWARPVAVTVVTTLVLFCVGLELQRRRDRLFVDQL